MPASLTIAATASSLVFNQVANFAAASWCSLWVDTAVEEPPQLPVAGALASHCGMGATFHFPAVSPAFPARTPGAHTAESQPTSVPLLSAAFHSGVYMGLLLMTPSSTSSPQNLATFWVGSSSMCTPHACA